MGCLRLFGSYYHFRLYVSSCYLKKFEKSIKNKKTTSSMFKLERAFASGLKELIANLLGKSRISGVCVYSSSKVGRNIVCVTEVS